MPRPGDPRIRVLRIIARMNVGGPAWEVAALQMGLDSFGVDSLLVTGTVGDGEADFLELRGLELPRTIISRLGRKIRPLGDLAALLDVIRVCRRFRPDIVHTHTAKAGVIGRIAAVITRVPIRVHSYHGHLLHGYFPRPILAFVVLVERLLGRLTTGFVAVGVGVRDDLVALGIGRLDRYVVIPPGVEPVPNIDRGDACRRLGIDDRCPTILFCGRLTPIKRPDRLIEAFRILHQRIPAARLLVVGSGELEAETRNASEDLGGSISFFGWRADTRDFYAAADVVVLTSDNEGMPVTLIEAGMSARPVVTTDAGSAEEVVVDGVTGLVVTKSPEALAEGLAKVLHDPVLAASFGRAAKEMSVERFGIDRLVADHVALYRAVMLQD